MAETTPSKGRSCCLYGCLGLIALTLLGALGLYLGVRYTFNAFVGRYTDDQPATLPKVQMAAEDLESLKRRVAGFHEAIESRQATEPLVLTAEELNALMASSPAWAAVKDKVYVRMEGGQLKGLVSIPLAGLNLSRLRGRYLNGSASLRIALTNGILSVGLGSVEIKGVKIRGRSLDEVQKVNLAEEASRDPQAAQTIQALESIEVKDGRVIITPKANR